MGTDANPDPTELNRSLAETATVIGITNLKSVGEQPAMLSNLAYSNTITNTNLSQQNAVANQQAMNEVGISIVGKIVNKVSDLSPLEARASVDVLTDNAIADEIASLRALIQAFVNRSSAS